jgi:hypothetical protein
MKYIRFNYSAGYCGTDTYEFGKFEDTATDEEIDEIAEELCENHCEMYGIYEDEENDVEPELDYSWREVPESEVEMNRCTDYTK